eukprot:jgi/Psemu1/43479/gm1.43479_g
MNEGGVTNELEAKAGRLTLQPKAQRLLLHTGHKCKEMATEQSNQINKHKERKVSLDLGHVENLGYLIQVPCPPATRGTEQLAGNAKVLLSDVDLKIKFPCFAVGSDVAIKDMPLPGMGVVKNSSYKKDNQFPSFPGCMVYKKKPDGTQVEDMPLPGMGVVKNSAYKKDNQFPSFPGCMVYKKKPDGTQVACTSWYMYDRIVVNTPLYNPLSNLLNWKDPLCNAQVAQSSIMLKAWTAHKCFILSTRCKFPQNSPRACNMSNDQQLVLHINVDFTSWLLSLYPLQDEDLNLFLYHFKTGFDALCARNDHLVLTILDICKQTNTVRTRLNSKKGVFDKEEALLIWEEAMIYVSQEVFLNHEESNSVTMDHIWAMGIILSYLLVCSYPTLKEIEDITCYNSIGIGPEWSVRTEEAIIAKEHLENLYFSTHCTDARFCSTDESTKGRPEPFLYHFETGYDCLCDRNGHLVLIILARCKLTNIARTRLKSRKGRFEEAEASSIWKEALYYVHYIIIPEP